MLDQLSRILFLAGSLPYVILGLVHAVLTVRDIREPTALSPARTGLRQAMAESPLLLTGRTNMWRAWLGFNLSHGLGAVFFGSVLLIVGVQDFRLATDLRFFMPLALGVSGAYLVLAIRFWFNWPVWAMGLGLACLLGSWIAGLAARAMG